jgi:hypothetical protein
MLTGLNTDVEHQGKVYHIQTEDGGLSNPVIITLLYHKGAILAKQKTGYGEVLKAQNLKAILRGLMDEQHRQMIEDLKTGRLSQEPSPAAGGAPPPGVSPLPIALKSLDEMVEEYLLAKEKEQDKVS